MKSKKIIFSFALFLLFIVISNICMAKDLDRINKYYITVDPRKDGSLDMTYYLEWKVLDSDSEGPLEWVKIGIPNSHVDMIKANSDNIRSVKYHNEYGDYIRVNFKKAYYAGETINFSFSFHQSYMYNLEGELAKYEFTPGWFEDIVVDEIMVFWNSKDVYSASSKNINSDNYYTWSDSLRKNEKFKVEVTYSKYSMNFTENKQAINSTTTSKYVNNITNVFVYIVIIFIVIMMIVILSPSSYRRHRGYGYGRSSYHESHYSSHHSSCASSCACVSSCACACACAGGGRAGCSKKDFYGTTIRTKKLNKVIEDKRK